MPLKIGKYNIGKECGGRWFPGIGRGYWDGLPYFIFRQKPKIRLKFRTFGPTKSSKGGFAIGPLMIWSDK